MLSGLDGLGGEVRVEASGFWGCSGQGNDGSIITRTKLRLRVMCEVRVFGAWGARR